MSGPSTWSGRRRLVVHHTHLIPGLFWLFQPDDVVFFDDCLYSQYTFLAENVDRMAEIGVDCVLGLSPKAMRPDGSDGMRGIESWRLHEALNSQVRSAIDIASGDYLRGFMCESEVRDLLLRGNVHLALHGCCHLRLETVENRVEQARIFSDDVDSGVKMLGDFGFSTEIFVYPYAFEPFLGERTLRSRGFRWIFAGNKTRRIPVEELKC